MWNTENAVPQPATGQTFQPIPASSCKLYDADCADDIDTDAEFTSSDHAVGTFVATVARERSPEIRTDGRGAPIEDTRSPVFCPTASGTTTLTLRVAGQVHQRRVVVRELPGPPPRDTPRQGGPAPVARGTCAFGFDEPAEALAAAPLEAAPVAEPAPIAPPTPEPPPAPGPNVPTAPTPPPDLPSAAKPAAKPQPPAPTQAPTVDVTSPAPVEALPAPLIDPAGDSARPPGLPPPVKPPPPPAPPSGLSQAPAPSPAQAPAPATQVAQVTAAAQQRREREAFEGSGHSAVAYRHPGARLPWQVGGGIALALVAGAGWTAGRCGRRPAPAYARQR